MKRMEGERPREPQQDGFNNESAAKSQLTSAPSCGSRGRSPSMRGFTLIELITVLAILSLLIATALGAYFAWNQTSALRGATDLTLSALNRARQFAITQREEVAFHFDFDDFTEVTPNRFYLGITSLSSTNLGYITPPIYLPLKTRVDIYDPDVANIPESGFSSLRCIYFTPEGRARDPFGNLLQDGTRFIVTLERSGTILTRAILIDPLTGHARLAPREEKTNTAGTP